MAVNRWWAFNAPSGSVDVKARAQVGIGFPLPFITPIVINYLDYLRNYLGDN